LTTGSYAGLARCTIRRMADMLPLINRFPDKPLIYNIAWKTDVKFSPARERCTTNFGLTLAKPPRPTRTR
jgi:hypothetical protein